MPSAPALNEQELRGVIVDRPKSVDNAFMVWLTSAAIGVLSLILSISLGRDQIRDAARTSLQGQNKAFTEADLNNAVTIATVFAILVGIIIAGLFLLFAYKMRAGRNWARITLTVLGALSILFTILGVGNSGVASLIVSLIQAALILIAVYFMYRPDANQYFAAGRRPR
jgi:uncharacterized membrane protein